MCGNELYLIFSMTKMLTCTCALQLFEEGKYLLSDPVSKFLPEFGKMRISYDDGNGKDASSITTGRDMGENVEKNCDGYAQNPITMRDLFTMSARLDYNLSADPIKKALSNGKKVQENS